MYRSSWNLFADHHARGGLRKFKDHLGVQHPPRLLSMTFQYAQLDEEVMVRCGSDGRRSSRGGRPAVRRELSAKQPDRRLGRDVEHRPGVLYYEIAASATAERPPGRSENLSWPDLTHPARFEGLAVEAKALRENTPYAIVALGYLTIFEHIQLLRGLEPG